MLKGAAPGVWTCQNAPRRAVYHPRQAKSSARQGLRPRRAYGLVPGDRARDMERRLGTQHAMSAVPVDYLISTLVTLFVVVDPLWLVPTFVAITHGLPRPPRRQIAIRSSLITADNQIWTSA